MSKGAFVIIAPNSMAFRAINNSDVLPVLYQQAIDQGFEKIILLSPADGSQKSLPEYIEWQDFLLPAGQTQSLPLFKRIIRAATIRCARYLGFDYANTVFRFNELNGFFAHKFKQGMSLERRKREELAGNFVSQKYGFPFPKSKAFYQWVYTFYYSKKHTTDPNISAFFKSNDIGKMIFWHVQNPIFREYSICARRQNIPYVAVIGSWDRPTTKGPLCPECDSYIVNSQVMQNELVAHHNIDASNISIVGWPQMDVYHDQTLEDDRSTFLTSLGIDAKNKILLYAGNAARLGAHEPSIVEHIAKQISTGVFGENVHLLIRPHPQDVDWESRYHGVNKENALAQFVTVMPADMGNIKTMVNTLRHADIVIATQGSISLDAAALDKKIINVAFDGSLKRSYTESVKRWYEMDHYVPVVESGGVSIVDSFQTLDTVIETLLQSDPQKEGRAKLREIELEPFAGDSSARQVQAMLL